MIDTGRKKLSVRRPAALLGVNRNRLPKCPGGAGKPPGGDLAILRDLDVLHTRWPFYGQRKLLVELRKRGWRIGRKRLRRLMQLAGIEVVAPKRRTSVPNASHRKYPYLLRGLAINHADQAWCADITYIRMERGFAYLVAVMDWHTRAVLAWRISNTLDTAFCVDALNDAVKVAGCVPEIFNTDQGCQFTSAAFTGLLQAHGSRISMDGRGRWLDNVFIERLWRSLKCENIYLCEYRNLVELEAGVAVWLHDYNHERIHQALGYQMPWQLYRPPAGEPNPEPTPKSGLAKAA
jgi:putative transposase